MAPFELIWERDAHTGKLVEPERRAGAFRSLLGQPAFWAVISSFIKHCWHLLRVQPAAAFMSKWSVKVFRKERGREERKRKGREEQKE